MRIILETILLFRLKYIWIEKSLEVPGRENSIGYPQNAIIFKVKEHFQWIIFVTACICCLARASRKLLMTNLLIN